MTRIEHSAKKIEDTPPFLRGIEESFPWYRIGKLYYQLPHYVYSEGEEEWRRERKKFYEKNFSPAANEWSIFLSPGARHQLLTSYGAGVIVGSLGKFLEKIEEEDVIAGDIYKIFYLLDHIASYTFLFTLRIDANSSTEEGIDVIIKRREEEKFFLPSSSEGWKWEEFHIGGGMRLRRGHYRASGPSLEQGRKYLKSDLFSCGSCGAHLSFPPLLESSCVYCFSLL